MVIVALKVCITFIVAELGVGASAVRSGRVGQALLTVQETVHDTADVPPAFEAVMV